MIKERFIDVGRVPQAFSSIKYIGTKTESAPTNFRELKKTVIDCLADNSVRSSRSPAIIYKSLVVSEFKKRFATNVILPYKLRKYTFFELQFFFALFD